MSGGRSTTSRVTAMSDGWMPAAFSKLGRFAIVPDVRPDDPLPRAAAGAAASGCWPSYRSRFSAGGAWEEDGELWAQDGTLLAQSRQLAMMRERGVSRSATSASAPTSATGAPICRPRSRTCGSHGVQVLASSSVYETEPVGEVLDQRDFLNACVRIETELEPEALLDACKAVERALGRAPGGVRHGPRPIDVDVLLLGNAAYESERLATAAPRGRTTRRFVLVPLLELDPGLDVPGGASLPPTRWPRSSGQDVRRAGPPLDVRPCRVAFVR